MTFGRGVPIGFKIMDVPCIFRGTRRLSFLRFILLPSLLFLEKGLSHVTCFRF